MVTSALARSVVGALVRSRFGTFAPGPQRAAIPSFHRGPVEIVELADVKVRSRMQTVHQRGRAGNENRRPTRRLLFEIWLVTAALVFLLLLVVGVDDPSAYPLIGAMSGCVSAEIIGGSVCVLKGYPAVGWTASIGWLTLPLSIFVSSTSFTESTASSLFGPMLGAGVVLVITALAVTTASRRARFGSWWDNQGWD